MIEELGYIDPAAKDASSLRLSEELAVVDGLGNSACLFLILVSCDGAAFLFQLQSNPLGSCK